jgi:hypothetical protein
MARIVLVEEGEALGLGLVGADHTSRVSGPVVGPAALAAHGQAVFGFCYRESRATDGNAVATPKMDPERPARL